MSWGGFIRPNICDGSPSWKPLAAACSTPTPGSFQGSNLAARLAAGACIEAVSYVLGGTDRRALCLVRPPGHHARPAEGMGFCIYANVALAAAEALARFDLNRILIADFDVHHGNGTQEIFYDSERVGFLSIHRYPFYPGTGARDETGTGAGLGFTMNIPLPYGTSRTAYHAAFRAGLEQLADRVRPELVLISAGFDAHAEDPVGDLGLEVEDFEILTKELVSVAQDSCPGRVSSACSRGATTCRFWPARWPPISHALGRRTRHRAKPGRLCKSRAVEL